MERNKLIDYMFKISKNDNAFDLLERSLSNISKKFIKKIIIECGVMPEIFTHDSSEEKLWAKYSDILLSHVFSFLGMDSKVIRVRGNSADVLAKDKNYSIVADAKTFRLSRTAKNQKDFKVKALNDWKRDNEFAMLAGPLNQFPSKKSQIYEQAIDKNVTLISYVHLLFLLNNFTGKEDLIEIWEIGKTLKNEVEKKDRQNASIYWQKIDLTICKIFNKKTSELDELKKLENEVTMILGKEGISYWKNKILEFRKLTKEKAIKMLIMAHKIEEKILQIEKTIKKNS